MPLDAASDELELSVPIGMLFAFDRLAVRLEAVAHRPEHLAHLRASDRESLLLEFPRQDTGTLDRPSQGRHRITSCAINHQRFQRPAESWLFALARFPTTTGPTLTMGTERLRRLEFFDPVLNGGTSQPGSRSDNRNTSTPNSHGFGCSPTARATFIKIHQNRSKLAVNRVDQFGIWHAPTDRMIRWGMSTSL